MENLFSVNQAAYILKVHPLTIRRYIREGKLKAMKAAGNIRIKELDLHEFNKEFTPAPAGPREQFRTKLVPAKLFNADDPFLRLKGRGANLHLS